MDEPYKVHYLCDGRQEECCKSEQCYRVHWFHDDFDINQCCHHTPDINHALNFCEPFDRDAYGEHNDSRIFWEIPRNVIYTTEMPRDIPKKMPTEAPIQSSKDTQTKSGNKFCKKIRNFISDIFTSIFHIRNRCIR